jgi:hypothetical protein
MDSTTSTAGWRHVTTLPPADDPVWRRFGREHDKPCRRPEVLTCALCECQRANECQDGKRPS